MSWSSGEKKEKRRERSQPVRILVFVAWQRQQKDAELVSQELAPSESKRDMLANEPTRLEAMQKCDRNWTEP